MTKIAVIVGSVRRESINLTLARALEKLAGPTLAFTYADIGSLPHYDDSLWPDPPRSVTDLKTLVEASDGVLFVTPEYNRSIPGALKNAIDWGSRPVGKNSWTGKPAGIVGTTPGVIGTAVAQAHLRSILPIFGMPLLSQPEVYLQFKPGLIDADLTVTDDKTRAFLQTYLARFTDWVERLATRPG